MIVEYKGELIAWKAAQRRYARSAAEDGHTFFFDLDDGRGDRRCARRQFGALG